MSRPPLTNHQLAGRARAQLQKRVAWLCRRLDSYVVLAENMRPGTKGRAAWLKKADTVREELRQLDH
jgi:hypothetical protein